MTKASKKTDDRGQENARAWLASIEEMVQALATAEEQAIDGPDETDAARSRIEESVLSVQVRDGWKSPGAKSEGPEEYEILLSTGGPALRIYGKLSDYNEPETAELQYQDWFTSWTIYQADEGLLLKFAGAFYFAE